MVNDLTVNDLAVNDLAVNDLTLEETTQELRRSQARLHHLQEHAVAQGALIQLREKQLQSQYELWVMKACIAWIKGEPLKVAQCLEASLDCTALEPQAIVADWLQRLDQFAREMQPVLGDRTSLSLSSLITTSEWKTLMQQAVANHPNNG